MAWTLCTKAQVVALHSIPIANLQDEWSNWAEAMIVQYTGNVGVLGDVVVTDEYLDGDSTNLIVLNKPKVKSIQSLYIDDVLIAPADYIISGYSIKLLDSIASKGILNIKISYTAGVDNIPAPYQFACVGMVSAIANHYQRAGADATLRWATVPEAVGSPSPNISIGLYSHIYKIMKQTLRREKVKIK